MDQLNGAEAVVRMATTIYAATLVNMARPTSA